jgi:hypothetical protein
MERGINKRVKMKARHKMGGGGGFKREKIVERNIKGKK